MRLLLVIATLSGTIMAIASTPGLDTNASPPQLADALAVQDPADIGALFNAQIVSSEDVALVPNDPRTTPSLVSDGEEDPLDFQDPPGCIQGVAEAPCAIMNVQRQCGSRAPIDIDLAKNYTFHRVRLSTIGGNWSMTLSFPPKKGSNRTDPIPIPGKAVAEFSNIINQANCRRWWGPWVGCAVDVVMTVVFAKIVVKLLGYLPIWGMFR